MPAVAKSLPVVMECPFASPSGDPTRRGEGCYCRPYTGARQDAELCKAGMSARQVREECRAPRLACTERTRTWGTGPKGDFRFLCGNWAVGAVPPGLGGIGSAYPALTCRAFTFRACGTDAA